MKTMILAALTSAITSASPVQAQDVRISTFKSDATFSLNGREFIVTRDQNTAATLQGEFALTSRACPPNCIQPMVAAPGVVTFGEIELLAFLEGDVTNGNGLLLDARLPADFADGSIPSAVNVPFMTLAADNRFRTDILRALGAVQDANGALDFSNAMALTLFSGGVWSKDARTGIEHLINAGYPADKIFFYRGGMQAWVHVGLTVQQTQNPG